MKFKEYITIIPFASRGLGGIHCSTIEDVVTFTGMIFIGGPEGTRNIIGTHNSILLPFIPCST